MKHTPDPLTWPLVVSLETARRQCEAANQALDYCFQEQPQPSDLAALGAALQAALDAAAQASVLEHYMRLDVPARQ